LEYMDVAKDTLRETAEWATEAGEAVLQSITNFFG
jgi:hypothetical protein